MSGELSKQAEQPSAPPRRPVRAPVHGSRAHRFGAYDPVGFFGGSTIAAVVAGVITDVM